MTRGTLIAFSGMDCAGKSTQIALVADEFARRGVDARVLWYRPGYSAELDAVRRTIRRFRAAALPSPADTAKRAEVFERPGVSTAWVAVASLDMLLQYGVKVRALRSAGVTVLCDRYLLDAWIDLELRFPKQRKHVEPMLHAVSHACPRPDAAVLLTLDEREALVRAARKREPFAEEAELRARRRAAYEQHMARFDVTPVDAGRSIDEVHADVLAFLLERRCM